MASTTVAVTARWIEINDKSSNNNLNYAIMKRTIIIVSVAFLLSVFLLSSCSFDKKGTATIYDGETQWNNWAYNFARGETNDGDLALWTIFFYTEIGNSLRTISLSMNTSESGTYSGLYDSNSGVWSNNAISLVKLTLDYDGQAYPAWYGQSATITIHGYNKETKAMSATLEAVVAMEGTSNTRNIRVKMDNLHLVDK